MGIALGSSPSLGETRAFLLGQLGEGFTLPDFRAWVIGLVQQADNTEVSRTFDWLPAEVSGERLLAEWVRDETRQLLESLEQYARDLEAGTNLSADTELLLDFLFDRSVLPTYAFPTDLASFQVEGPGERHGEVAVQEKPQQAIAQALSEYAPGRLVVIDKETYRSGGVAANVPPTVVDRAALLFARASDYVYCPHCSFVAPPIALDQPSPGACPLCLQQGGLIRRLMITPEVFHPEEARRVHPTDRDQDYTYASSAQFPVPVDGADVAGLRPYGVHAELTYARSQPLVVVNRGAEETSDGFWVCDRCGAASLNDGPAPVRHPHRPYLVQRPPGQPAPGHRLGQFRQVFLGHQFRSDLMLLRVTLDWPFQCDTADRVFRSRLGGRDAELRRALALGASRALDIDPAEFSGGHRLWHQTEDGGLRFDVYLFDTLAGGAGYAEEAGRELDQVLDETARILADCTCDTSCQNCLRHYGNRIDHEQLDRFLATQLLDFVRDGRFPPTDDLDRQVEKLQPLKRMFELDAYEAESDVPLDGQRVPLLVRRGERQVAVGTYPVLLDETCREFEHPLTVLAGAPQTAVGLVSDYRLSRNLPGAYQQVRTLL